MMVPFKSRWLIEGELTLLAPLELRTGAAASRPVRDGHNVGDDDDDRQSAEVALVHRDCRGLPCIVGSSLKGALRSWLSERLPKEKDSIERVFGHEPRPWKKDETKAVGLGGKAEFLDAFIVELARIEGPVSAVPPPQIGRAAIDRHTRTAAFENLFHGEQVPAATAFTIAVAGDSLKVHEVALLLAAFQGFNTKAGDLSISLGGGGSRGTGRARWRLRRIRCMDPRAVARWLKGPQARRWQEVIVSDRRCRRGTAPFAARAEKLLARAERPAWVALDLRLSFSGPFLVNDPEQVKDREEGKNHPNFEPMRDPNGRPLLPGSSVKGALRAQAERIVRTVFGTGAVPQPEENRDGTPRNEIEWLFGVGGWRGMLTVSDFIEANPPADANKGFSEQEFVAIDRFTGGAAEGAKFKARIAEAPVLRGRLHLRVSPRRLPHPHPREEQPEEPWTGQYAKPALGLMALLLRDLIEGDIPFGFGAAKGFGACSAEITGLKVDPTSPACTTELAKLPKLDEAQAAGWPIAGGAIADLYREMLRSCIEAFHDKRSPAAPQETNVNAG